MDSKFEIDPAYFKLAVENAPIHIFITNPEGKIIYANFASFAVTGYSVSEIIGKTPALWGGHMEKEFYEKLWNTIKVKQETFFSEVRNKRKDGRFYHAKLSIVPLIDQSNKLTGFVGIEEDITLLKDAQDFFSKKNN